MSAVKHYETKEISCNDNHVINFLYHTLPGRMLLQLLVKPVVSRSVGFLMDCRFSKLFVPAFIRNSKICLDEYKDVQYKSFNDFFTRKIKDGFRPIPPNPLEVIAPCDGRLTAYPITNHCVFRIKNSVYDVNSLLGDTQLADEFAGGVCLIFRLTPDAYHRYCYVDDGEIISTKKIEGVFHTVRPIAVQRYNVYAQNAREYAVLQTRNFGRVIQMEVGALLIGRIVNHVTNGVFKRGEEKGMFEFGGSTIVMLFQKDAIKVDEMIYRNTQSDKETIVKMGNKIGEKQ